MEPISEESAAGEGVNLQDLTSCPAVVAGKQPDPLHIEVKGRVKDTSTITVTRNELLYALNQSEKLRLAIVLVGEDDVVDGPFYVKAPFTKEPIGESRPSTTS